MSLFITNPSGTSTEKGSVVLGCSNFELGRSIIDISNGKRPEANYVV